MFKTIIWATDGSETADVALPFAKELAERDHGVLLVVHAKEILIGRGGGYPVVADEEDVEQKLVRQTDALRKEGLDATFKLVSEPAHDAASMIAEVARDQEADAIVLGTRGHSTIAGLLVGSVTHRLLHIAPCPVLAVPPAKRAVRPRQQEAIAVAT
jgi:nucleotide-binding universal stress UspA family protein